MNKNRIEGRHGTTIWHNTAKSSGLPVEVNAVVARGSIVPLPGEISPARAVEKSAEAIVVGETSRSANEHSKVAGGLTQRRAELHGNVLTAWRTVNPSKTPDGEVEPKAAAMGKHVGVQEQASACFLRGLVPCPSGTAVYGPVRTVVWDPWLALAVSHGDPILRLDSPALGGD